MSPKAAGRPLAFKSLEEPRIHFTFVPACGAGQGQIRITLSAHVERIDDAGQVETVPVIVGHLIASPEAALALRDMIDQAIGFLSPPASGAAN